MAQDVSQLKQALSLLTTPAFFTDGETVLWANEACSRLPLRRGDTLAPILGSALPLYRDRDTGAAAHLTVGAGDTVFSANVQRFGEQDLFLLSANAQPNADALGAIAASIRGALSDLMSVGAKLFPQLEEAEDERLQEQTAAMSRACFRLLRTVGALQCFARVNAACRPNLAQTDLTALLRELSEHAEDALRDAGITLRTTLPDAPVSAYADGDAIRYAVLQLLVLVCCRCGSGSAVALHVTANGRHLHIRISTSEGAPASDAFADAFTPFRMAEGSGAGLETPIARAIAQQHGGSVLLESDGGKLCATMTIGLTLRAPSALHDTQVEYRHGYDPVLVELSDILPPQTFDSRNIDL